MSAIAQNLEAVRGRIRDAETRHGRVPGSVRLLAVSKTHPPNFIRAAHGAGQVAFGENYLQEAEGKMKALADLDLEWHFIGPLQSNKTRAVAERFAWVHTVDREKIGRRLAGQRPPALGPLNACIQVNVSGEATKAGVVPADVAALARALAPLPGLRLRGLMCIPAPAADFEAQRAPLRVLAALQRELNAAGLGLDTLSMGMTADLEAAVAEGSTLVRVGTGIFGPRTSRPAAG